MEKIVIEVSKKGGDCKAQAKGEPARLGSGKNGPEAIGKLIIGHEKFFGIEPKFLFWERGSK